MAPVGYGVLAMIAGIIVLALLVGAVGGVITGRVRGDLALGATLSAIAYVLLVIILESWSSRKFALFGILPFMLTFVVGSTTSRLLETRFGLRPILASLAALGCALCVGFMYMMMIKVGWLGLADPPRVWLAAGLFACLVIMSMAKWYSRRTRNRGGA